jgi:hypothetical protein
MGVPPRRRRAGKIDIDNKKRGDKTTVAEEKPVTPEEHEERMKLLREAGIIK